jgi:hypothetical protein
METESDNIALCNEIAGRQLSMLVLLLLAVLHR